MTGRSDPVSSIGMPTIRIAAALIDDGLGRILLVRKAGTTVFMQAGGKIEEGETPLAAMERELAEELGLTIDRSATPYLGRFVVDAAHERGHLVDADLFHVRTAKTICPAAEIAEAGWFSLPDAHLLELAPLTEQHVLRLAYSL